MNILGIESSCDETSVAIISDEILSANLIASQDFHFKYGGVVPELSSRAHLQMVNPLLRQALEKSNMTLKDIDVIASTAGPGLIGALLVGLTFAKGLAYSLDKPFVSVNHIEGHIFSGFLMDEKPEFPMLSLVVSGGHTLLLVVEDDIKIKMLGTTIDDAAGEAFDKVSKMLNLGYPGGPMIQKYAEKGNQDSIDFPIAQLNNKYDFSFSGVKTSVLRHVQANYDDFSNIPEKDKYDIAASFQKSVISALSRKVSIALNEYKINSVSVVGGVAANVALASSIDEICKGRDKKFVIPSLEFCGDNAAMIAYRGGQLFKNGRQNNLEANAFPSLNFQDYGRKSKRGF